MLAPMQSSTTVQCIVALLALPLVATVNGSNATVAWTAHTVLLIGHFVSTPRQAHQMSSAVLPFLVVHARTGETLHVMVWKLLHLSQSILPAPALCKKILLTVMPPFDPAQILALLHLAR